MTHEEALELVPIYALGALDERVAELEEHIGVCEACRVSLASYEETAAALGQALAPVAPPPSLRERVLVAVPEAAVSPAPPLNLMRLPRWLPSSAAAALLVVALGLGVWNARQRAELATLRQTADVDERGLELLTSTETANDRLNPVVAGAKEHGHWFHQTGQSAQVLVVEFMPLLGPGDAYYGWFQRRDGSWLLAGTFQVDGTGYGRLILLGSDGADVQRVEVTRQTQATSAPSGTVVLVGTRG